MSTTVKLEDNLIQVKQYITDKKGHKIAAIIEIDELERLKEMLEDLSDLKAIEERKNEPGGDYEAIQPQKPYLQWYDASKSKRIKSRA